MSRGWWHLGKGRENSATNRNQVSRPQGGRLMLDYVLYTRLEDYQAGAMLKDKGKQGWRVAFFGVSGGFFWALLERKVRK